jgi:hypothetical protein
VALVVVAHLTMELAEQERPVQAHQVKVILEVMVVM